jgi:hypothetical protein
MEKNMSGIQPQSLSDEELERYTYLQAGALPAELTEQLRQAFAKTFGEPKQDDDPRQLRLFDQP